MVARGRRPGRTLVAAVALLATAIVGPVLSPAGASPAAPAGSGGSPGSDGLGDPFFPLAGNGGYDVTHYDLAITWDPANGSIDGEATLDATATQNLSRFDLDFRAFTIGRLTVGGRTAPYTRSGQELVIHPARSIRAGDPMHVVVRYRGVPQTVIDPDGSVDGWIPVDDGAIALCEPQGAPTWFPVNDYPTDKATFDVRVTVPGGYTVMGNGTPSPPAAAPGARTTFEWTEDNPMAPYLTTIAIGQFVTTSGQTPSGVPIHIGVDPRQVDASAPALAQLGTMVDWLTSLFGPYPFDTVGAIVDRAPQVGYALETQTRPTFTSAPGEFTLVHELAHQWFGDSVSLARWPEMWLNEGFATYVEWLWSEHEGQGTARQQFIGAYQSIPAGSQFWTIPPAALPDPTQLFGGAVYERGAMTLGALRETVGDADFFTILQTWANTYKYGNVSTPQFEALAETVSGLDLSAFFDAWLLEPSKPPRP